MLAPDDTALVLTEVPCLTVRYRTEIRIQMVIGFTSGRQLDVFINALDRAGPRTAGRPVTRIPPSYSSAQYVQCMFKKIMPQDDKHFMNQGLRKMQWGTNTEKLPFCTSTEELKNKPSRKPASVRTPSPAVPGTGRGVVPDTYPRFSRGDQTYPFELTCRPTARPAHHTATCIGHTMIAAAGHRPYSIRPRRSY